MCGVSRMHGSLRGYGRETCPISSAKQMVLSAALDNGYIFLSLIAIITSVIGAVYYLTIIKEIFFFPSEYKVNPNLKNC